MSEITSDYILEQFNEIEEYILVNKKSYIHISTKEKSDNYFNRINQHPFTWDEIKETLGRQYKHVIESMIPLLVFIGKQDDLAMISCKLFKDCNPQKTELNIKKLIKLDIIQCVSNHYSKDDGIAKIYNINFPRFDLFLDLIREDHNIREKYNKEVDKNKNKYNNNEEEIIEDNEIVEVDDEDECEYFESLDSKEDKLRDIIRDLIKQQNKLQTKDIFRYNLKLNGGRPACRLCNYDSKEKAIKLGKKLNPRKTYREDVLDSYFEEDHNIREKYKEYDRSNSIYKVNDYIRNKRVRVNDRNVDDIYLNLVNGKKEQRDYIKEMVMTLYFSDARKWRSTVTQAFEYFIDKKQAARHIALKGNRRVQAVMHLLVENGHSRKAPEEVWISDIVEWYKTTKEKLKKEVGKFVGKSIFLYEAIVNLSTEIDLLEKGYKCVSVYDGFWTNASEEEWWESYTKSLNKIKEL